MSWKDQLNADPLPWLLEAENASVRYLALRDLLDRPGDDPELLEACQATHRSGPIAIVLDAMDPNGFWMRKGPGVQPKISFFGMVADAARPIGPLRQPAMSASPSHVPASCRPH